jgi:hypothetical protein
MATFGEFTALEIQIQLQLPDLQPGPFTARKPGRPTSKDTIVAFIEERKKAGQLPTTKTSLAQEISKRLSQLNKTDPAIHPMKWRSVMGLLRREHLWPTQ